MADAAALQETLGLALTELSLLGQALVHSSYINENPGVSPISNERLEFLGDAVLGLIVAENLYKDFPDISEGEMTRLRAALVRRETMARIAEAIRLGDYLYLGKGEEASGGRHKPANLASALEALIAAVFLDQGLAVTAGLVSRLFSRELAQVVNQSTAFDYKSRLQEFMQANYQLTPAYRLVETSGPDHDRMFKVEVMAGGAVLGTGSGKSKKLAEIEAARSALEHMPDHFTR